MPSKDVPFNQKNNGFLSKEQILFVGKKLQKKGSKPLSHQYVFSTSWYPCPSIHNAGSVVEHDPICPLGHSNSKNTNKH